MTWWENRGFSLLRDGDRYERLWWPLLKDEFPQYEAFWVKHIVPLTNRIDPEVLRSDPKWIGLRDDAKISEHIESMAMSHYSVFYYLSRATLVILYDPHPYLEEAFWLLGTAVYNLQGFLDVWHEGLAKLLTLPVSALPQQSLKGKEPFKEISDYRDALTHAPVLGRAHYLTSEWLPKRTHLPSAEKSWRSAQGLPPAEYVESRALLRRLRAVLLVKLGTMWDEVGKAVETVRSQKVYRDCYNLDEHYCIPGKGQPSSNALPSALELSSPAVSTTVVSSATSPGALHSTPGATGKLE
jgi:hypothetical protein